VQLEAMKVFQITNQIGEGLANIPPDLFVCSATFSRRPMTSFDMPTTLSAFMASRMTAKASLPTASSGIK
jgi:hypothetical protein